MKRWTVGMNPALPAELDKAPGTTLSIAPLDVADIDCWASPALSIAGIGISAARAWVTAFGPV